MVAFNDNFTNADATALGTHNANWVNAFNDTWAINTNAAYKSTANNGFGAYRWNQATDGDDQFAEGTVAAVGAGRYIGVAVRASGNSAANSTFYGFMGTTNESFLIAMVNGSDTQLGAALPAFTVGDVVRIEVEGQAPNIIIRAYIDGVLQATITGNSAINSGQVGISGFGSNTDTRIDAWSGGDLGGGTVPTVTDVGDESFRVGELGVVVTGTNFGASQGNGRVRICPSDDIDDANGVNQTVTGWGDTSATINIVASASLPRNTNLFLFVENDGGESNADGYVVQITPPPAVLAFHLLN